jgi:hypothetical protein
MLDVIETSRLMELPAASQSLATTAAANRACTEGDDLSSSLILFALPQYQNEVQRNNSSL